jgi:hypothetical protein
MNLDYKDCEGFKEVEEVEEVKSMGFVGCGGGKGSPLMLWVVY